MNGAYFLPTWGSVHSDGVIYLDMSINIKRSSHAAIRLSTKRVCMKRICRSTEPICRYAR